MNVIEDTTTIMNLY